MAKKRANGEGNIRSARMGAGKGGTQPDMTKRLASG